MYKQQLWLSPTMDYLMLLYANKLTQIMHYLTNTQKIIYRQLVHIAAR